jgi:peptidoglycan-N-acetylglucosamine deacetylase
MWGPESRPAAVSLTFDHLGEAAAIEQNRWPADQPVGEHFSVTRVVPRLLEFLGSVGVRATFFVEGWNADVYPEALRAIAGAGHEVGYHGWRHESWARLSEGQARDLLRRGVSAFSGLAIQPRGLRAPGGSQPASTLQLLPEYGFRYFSLPGHAPTVYEGLASIPYEWRNIDAYYYSPRLAELRHTPDPLSPADLERTLDAALDQADYLTLLFHTQLLDEPERWAVFERVVQRVVASPRLWCAPHHAIADWMLTHPDDFPHGLNLDQTSWDPADHR